jgi:hypothetical protein
MLLAEEYLDPPAALTRRQFQRYKFESIHRSTAQFNPKKIS